MRKSNWAIPAIIMLAANAPAGRPSLAEGPLRLYALSVI